MRVLVGIDGSEGGWEAVRQSAALMSPTRDELVLYFAPPPITLRRLGRVPNDMVARTRRALADSIVAEGLTHVPEALRSRTQYIVGEKPARHGLALAAEQGQVDLIAVGGTAGGLAEAILGSVPRSLVHSTTRPLLIARKKKQKQTDGVYRVLFCLDEVPQIPASTDLLRSVSWPAPCQGELLHVVEPLLGMVVPSWMEAEISHTRDESISRVWREEYEAEKREKFEELRNYSQHLPAPFTAAPSVVLEGVAAQQILETARNASTDLLVVGTRGISAWERMIVGSTTEQLLTHAPCSMLVLHYGAKP